MSTALRLPVIARRRCTRSARVKNATGIFCFSILCWFLFNFIIVIYSLYYFDFFFCFCAGLPGANHPRIQVIARQKCTKSARVMMQATGILCCSIFVVFFIFLCMFCIYTNDTFSYFLYTATSEQVTDASLIARHDSTLSAMRCLLESSQEPSPIKHVNPVDTPRVTPDANDADVSTMSEGAASEALSQSQDTMVHESQDSSLDSTPIEGKDNSSMEAESLPLKGKSPPPMDSLDHSEHLAVVLSEVSNRCSLRTRNPRLWRHECQVFDSFCAYAGACFNKNLFCITLFNIIYFNPFYFHMQVLTMDKGWRLQVSFGRCLAKTGRSFSVEASGGKIKLAARATKEVIG